MGECICISIRENQYYYPAEFCFPAQILVLLLVVLLLLDLACNSENEDEDEDENDLFAIRNPFDKLLRALRDQLAQGIEPLEGSLRHVTEKPLWDRPAILYGILGLLLGEWLIRRIGNMA